MADGFDGDKIFENVKTVNDFYIQVSVIAGDKLNDIKDTIIFIDEIQIYPHLLTMLKPLKKDNKYKYICSGSLLGIALMDTTLIPMGSFKEVKMYPMDFEEFLMANGVGNLVLEHLKKCFDEKRCLDEALHEKILALFKTYLYVGGFPDAIKMYLETKNIFKIREVHDEAIKYYGSDASKYD